MGETFRKYGRVFAAVLGFFLIHGVVSYLVHEYLPEETGWSLVIIGAAQLGFSTFVALCILGSQATDVWQEARMLFEHGVAIGAGTGERTRVKRSILRFLRPRLLSHFTEGRSIFGAGLTISKDELGLLVTAAFKACRGAYVGTDKNLPSEFDTLYPLYLDRQIAGRRKKDDHRSDVRFIIQSMDALRADFAAEPQEFRQFVNRHINSGITLLQIDPERAARACTDSKLPSEQLGIYGNEHAIFFSHPSNDHFVISLQLFKKRKSNANEDLLGERVEHYIDRINAHAREIVFKQGQLAFRQREDEEVHQQRDRMRLGDLHRPRPWWFSHAT